MELTRRQSVCNLVLVRISALENAGVNPWRVRELKTAFLWENMGESDVNTLDKSP